MATTETIDFEGLAATNKQLASIPVGYEGLGWTGFGAADKGWVHHHATPPDGYDSVIHGHGVGYTKLDSTYFYTHSLITGDGLFSLKSGLFAIVGTTSPAVVTFTTSKGHMTATIDANGSMIHFNHKFAHVSEVEITTEFFSYAQVAMDNLKVVLDEGAGHAHVNSLLAHDLVHHTDMLGAHGLDALC